MMTRTTTHRSNKFQRNIMNVNFVGKNLVKENFEIHRFQCNKRFEDKKDEILSADLVD